MKLFINSGKYYEIFMLKLSELQKKLVNYCKSEKLSLVITENVRSIYHKSPNIYLLYCVRYILVGDPRTASFAIILFYFI